MRISLDMFISGVLLFFPLFTTAALPPAPKNFYHPGDLIDVTCLNRTMFVH